MSVVGAAHSGDLSDWENGLHGMMAILELMSATPACLRWGAPAARPRLRRLRPLLGQEEALRLARNGKACGGIQWAGRSVNDILLRSNYW